MPARRSSSRGNSPGRSASGASFTSSVLPVRSMDQRTGTPIVDFGRSGIALDIGKERCSVVFDHVAMDRAAIVPGVEGVKDIAGRDRMPLQRADRSAPPNHAKKRRFAWVPGIGRTAAPGAAMSPTSGSNGKTT